VRPKILSRLVVCKYEHPGRTGGRWPCSGLLHVVANSVESVPGSR
jgi:hypothetical protein